MEELVLYLIYQSNPRMPIPPPPPPPWQTPGHLTFSKNFGQIPHHVASSTVKCPTGWGFTEHQIPLALDMWVVTKPFNENCLTFHTFKTILLLNNSNLIFKLLRAFKCKLCVNIHSINKHETINNCNNS